MVILDAPFAAYPVSEEPCAVSGVDADRGGVIGDVLACRALELSREVFGPPPCSDERVGAEQSELDGIVERKDAGDARFDPTAVGLYFFLASVGFLALTRFSAFLRTVVWFPLI